MSPPNVSDFVSSFVYTKKVALLAATGFGVGCGAYLAWKNWDDIKSTLSNASSAKSESRLSSSKQHSSVLQMGQQISSGQGGDYQRPSSESVSLDEDNGNFVSNSLYENEALLNGDVCNKANKQHSPNRSASVTPTENCSTSIDQNGRHSFKKVIVRSRFCDKEGNNLSTDVPVIVIDKQPSSASKNGSQSLKPESSSLAANGNGRRIDITSKVRGFSHEEYQNSLQHKLNSLYGTNKLISNEDAKCLVVLLQQKSDETLLKTLTTMCNLAAFTVNQDFLRQNGAIEVLVELLHDGSVSDSVRLMLTQCIGNMSVNVKNHPLLQRCVPKIVETFTLPDCSELQKIMCVQALTNLSVEISSQNALAFVPAISVVLERLWSYTTGANVSSLKFLVNLSCSATLSHQILAAKAPLNLFDILSSECGDDALIRSTTFFCYLCSTVDALNLKLSDFRSASGDVSVEKSVFYAMFMENGGNTFKNVTESLVSHRIEEIAQRAKRILSHLKNFQQDALDDKLKIDNMAMESVGISST